MAIKTRELASAASFATVKVSPSVCVFWIDWYAYHVARFRALLESGSLHGPVSGVEMVGGTGVHRGLKFREALPLDLPITTLFEGGSWNELSKFKIARAVWKYLAKTRPEVLMVPGYYNLPALTVALWGRLHGKRTVLMTESTEADHRRRYWVERAKSLLIRSLFSWSIAGGAPHVRYLRKLYFPETRIAHRYDVIDNGFFREQAFKNRQRHTARDFRLPENYFLFVGRLAEEKNVAGLIGAYRTYRDNGGTWSLVLVGDGPMRETVHAIAKKSMYDNDISFEGLKSSKDLSPYYAFAGCFVLPSSREPWGLVVNEAMASGLPVLVTRECGCAEDLVKDGKNGFVYNANDQATLIQKLHRFEEMTAAERKSMGDNSLEIISRYSPESWAAEVARIANA